VVGGGRVARRKAEGLLACGAEVVVVASRISDEVRALGLACEERPYERGDAAGFRLVITATDDPAVNRAVFEDAEGAGVWVNSADDPANCSFTLPAVARRGPVTIAVGTQGQSPALASWLRDRLAEGVGPEYEALARLLSTERDALRESGRSTEGLDWHKALDSGMLELVRAGRIEEAKERLQACLSSS
jgi:siroheme synthase-like protein